MSALMDLQYPESLEYIKKLMSDKNWRPPTYVFMDGSLTELAIVNWCTILDDEDAFVLFERYPGSVFLKKKGEDDKYRIIPVQFNLETKKVEPLG